MAEKQSPWTRMGKTAKEVARKTSEAFDPMAVRAARGNEVFVPENNWQPPAPASREIDPVREAEFDRRQAAYYAQKEIEDQARAIQSAAAGQAQLDAQGYKKYSGSR